MKKRILSFLLAFALLGSLFCAGAVEAVSQPRASLYLDGYAVGVTAKGNGKMSVSFIVYGTGTMDKIGAETIMVEEWDGIEWIETGTYPAEKNPNFLTTKASEYTSSVTFYGLPGVQYRATLTAYAERNGGSDTGTVTSNPTTCK
jgi:hypothetical protein